MAHAPSFQSNYCTQTFHRSQMLLCNNVILHTCESCLWEGVRLSLTQSRSDGPRTLRIRDGGDPEERQDLRLDQRRAFAGGWQAKRGAGRS